MSPTDAHDTETDDDRIVLTGRVPDLIFELGDGSYAVVEMKHQILTELTDRSEVASPLRSAIESRDPTLVRMASEVAGLAHQPAGQENLLIVGWSEFSEEDRETLRAEAERQGRSPADLAGEAVQRYAAFIRRREVLDEVRRRFEEEVRRDGRPDPGRALREFDEAHASLGDDEYTEAGAERAPG